MTGLSMFYVTMKRSTGVLGVFAEYEFIQFLLNLLKNIGG